MHRHAQAHARTRTQVAAACLGQVESLLQGFVVFGCPRWLGRQWFRSLRMQWWILWSFSVSVCLSLFVFVFVYMRACATRQTRKSFLRVWQCRLLVSAWRSLRTDRAAPCCWCRWERLPCLDNWDGCLYLANSRVSWDDFMDGSASGLSARQHASSILILPASVRWFCFAATGRARVRCRPVCWKAGWDTDGR